MKANSKLKNVVTKVTMNGKKARVTIQYKGRFGFGHDGSSAHSHHSTNA